ncbi:c-type cytochrome [Pedobacter sp. UYEF25]
MKILKTIGFLLLFVLVAVIAAGTYVNFALPNTGPAQQIQIARTNERLERGRYLANHVTACMDCHSTRDWTNYAGPILPKSLGGGGEMFDEKMGFPGKIFASNITPHGLSNWTDGEILRAVTTGETSDGRALFPLMGYERFGRMDKEDILCIIAYVRSLAPINKEVPTTKLNFPVNFITKTIPKPASFQKRPASTDAVRYGGYLVNAAGCVECHSKSDKGKVIAGTEFGGGMEFNLPSGTLRAPNITSDEKNGIGLWSKENFIKRFKIFEDKDYKSPKVGMTVNNTVMPWTVFSGMTETDLGAIYSYLRSVKPSSNKVVVRTFDSAHN